MVKIEQVGFEKEAECQLGEYQDNISHFGLREKDIRQKMEKLLVD